MKENPEVVGAIELLPKVNWFRVAVGELWGKNFEELRTSLDAMERGENVILRSMDKPEIKLKMILSFSYKTEFAMKTDAYVVDSLERFQALQQKYFSKPQPLNISVRVYAVRADDLEKLVT